MLGVFSLQFGAVAIHFWENVFNGEWEDLNLDIFYLIRMEFVTATVLISYGAVIGKFNMGQYLVMALIEISLVTLN